MQRKFLSLNQLLQPYRDSNTILSKNRARGRVFAHGVGGLMGGFVIGIYCIYLLPCNQPQTEGWLTPGGEPIQNKLEIITSREITKIHWDMSLQAILML